MIKKLSLLIFISYISILNANEIIVEGYRVQPYNVRDNSTVEVDKEQLNSVQLPRMGEVLNSSSGVFLIDSPWNSSIFLRGAQSHHTQVLIDGMEVADPSTPNRNYDLSLINLEEIQSLSLSKSAYGSFNGANALAGTLSLSTEKKPFEQSKHFSGVLGGNFYSFNGSISEVINNKNYWNLSVYHQMDNSISSAAPSGDEIPESDKIASTIYNGSYTTTPKPGRSLTFKVRFTQETKDLDDYSTKPIDDFNYQAKNNHLMTQLQFKDKILNNRLQHRILVGRSSYNRKYNNEKDEVSGDWSRSTYKSSYLKLEDRGLYLLNENNNFNYLINFKKEGADFSSKGESYGYAYDSDKADNYSESFTGSLAYNLSKSTYQLTSSLSVSTHTKSDTVTTYQLSGRYSILYNLFIKASVSSGAQFPSLYQLYSSYGSQDLNSEKSRSQELGVEYHYSKKIKSSLTLFYNNYENLIGFKNNHYININKSTTSGVELTFNLKASNSFSLNSDLSILNSKDKSTGKKLERRPNYKLGINASYQRGQMVTTINFTNVGKRYEPSSPTDHLDSYSLLNINLSYQLEKGLKLWAKIYNLTNTDYEEVYGYQTRDRKLYSGVLWNF